MAIALSTEEKKWREESDARTLAETDVINKTPARLRGAQRAAKRILAKQQKEVAGLQKVAGQRTTKSSTPREGNNVSRKQVRKAVNNHNVFQRIGGRK